MKTIKYLMKRILSSLFTLFLILTVVFLLLRLLPDEKYIPEDAPKGFNETQIAAWRVEKLTKLGFYNEDGERLSTIEQLLNYYYQILPIPKELCVEEGYKEFGSSEKVCIRSEKVYSHWGEPIFYKPVSSIQDIIKERFPISFYITLASVAITYAIAYPLGVIMAMKKGKTFDKVGNGFIILSIAMPPLVVYYMVMMLQFFLGIPIIFDSEIPVTWITPVVVMGLLGVGMTTMWVRRYMVDELNSDYVKFARSKGLSERRIMYTHVLRNAIVFLARGFATTLLFAVVGAYFAETLWNIPGSGRLLISSINKGDLPLIQALVVVYAVLSMAAILLGDFVTILLDPRISLTKNK